MILNVIDFNDNLKKSYRNRYCLYRNLELGHEIHVYNENSKLMKACQSTLTNEMKNILKRTHFSPTYEYYKLFLMQHIEGWFVESDTIVYSTNLNPNKTVPGTMPIYYNSQYCLLILNFCTWMPIYIHLDEITKFFLKRSLDTLYLYIKEDMYQKGDRMSELFCQEIIAKPYCSSYDGDLKDLCEKFNFINIPIDYVHHSVGNLETIPPNYVNPDSPEKVQDYKSAKLCLKRDQENNIIFIDKSLIYYDDLLKFDTFKIMP